MKNLFKIILGSVMLMAPFCADAQDRFRQYAFDNYNKYYRQAREFQSSKEQKKGMDFFREYYSLNTYRKYDLTKIKMSAAEIVSKMNDEGRFTDMIELEEDVLASGRQDRLNTFLTDAFNRIWKVAEEFRSEVYGFSMDRSIFGKCQKAILYYGNIELCRPNVSGRFHASCFAIPTAAVNTYFSFYPQMKKVESGKSKDQQLNDTHDMLMALGLQAWTQPLRNDETDKNVVSIDRFRNHVWWVDGNAIAYRSLLPVAIMFQSVEMVELLRELAQRAIGRTSQNTYSDAFWIEGCTEDGAGWGHGKQSLVWGYPVDGMNAALNLLTSFNGSKWETKLSEENKYTLMNYIQGSNWYYYKGFNTPFVDRTTSRYNPDKMKIKSVGLVNSLLKNYADSFDGRQRAELIRFQKEAEKMEVNMEGYADGVYSGTRWFFNNDDLIKKNSSYHIFLNMASVRCDGLESAHRDADAYNFYPTDGMTLFQKNGHEYYNLTAAWDVTATPGVTAREGMDKLTPVTNWRGYCSKYNFAAAATAGGENAVAGYIFEKMNASDKENVNDKGNNAGQNPVLYGVKAYKSWFMFGDYTLALGAGITNLEPEQEGTVRTTIDNTSREANVIAMMDGKQVPVGAGVWSFLINGKPVWVIQEGKFAYTVLPEFTKNAYFCKETLKTDWVKYNSMNKGKKDLPASVESLRLWIDHGREVKDGTYGYVVYAGDRLPSEDLPFEVLRNDTLVQAAATKDRKTVEAVFYEPKETLKAKGVELSVSAPCAVMVDGNRLSITDAAMNAALKEIVVVYNGKETTVTMPQGGLCGKPVTVEL